MLRLPVDFERLPEFRQLSQVLGNDDAGATFLVLRLFVELAYAAQTTNRTGWLSPQGVKLYEQSVQGASKRPPLEVLVEAGILDVMGEPTGGGYQCRRFAQLNAHLAGNFKSRELRGAAGSALERNKHNIAREAQAQAMLLPPEMFKRNGQAMTDSEVNRCMVLIRTMDNCLKAPGRSKRDFTEGLIADASAVAENQNLKPGELREFYVWLQLNRDHPAVPKTTEQILANWETVQLLRGTV